MTTTRNRDAEFVMGMLARHVPLLLLLDLVDPTGPRSSELYEAEREQRSQSRVWDSVRVDVTA